MGAIPTDLPLVNEPSLDWGNHPRSPGFTMSFSQLARHVGAGQLGVTNAQWAHNSPLLRSCLQASSGMEPDQTRPLVQCAEVGPCLGNAASFLVPQSSGCICMPGQPAGEAQVNAAVARAR